MFLEKTQGIVVAFASLLSLLSMLSSSLTFCKISIITEDIYLKLGVSVHHPKRNPYYQGRQFKMHFFFQNYGPFSKIVFLFLCFVLYQAPYSRALTPTCVALVKEVTSSERAANFSVTAAVDFYVYYDSGIYVCLHIVEQE